GQRADGHDVAESDRQERRGREVHGAAEARGNGLDLVAKGKQDEAIPHDQAGQPGGEEHDRGGRREEPQDGVVGPVRPPVAERPKTAPRAADQVPADPEPAGGRPWDDDRLEQVPEGEREKQDAEDESDGVYRLPMMPRRRWPLRRASR